MLSVHNSRKQLVIAAMGFLRLYENLVAKVIDDELLLRRNEGYTLYIPLGHADQDKMFRLWFYLPHLVVGIIYQVVPSTAVNPFANTIPVIGHKLIPVVYHDSCWRTEWNNFLWRNAGVITDALTLRPFAWSPLDNTTEALFRETFRRGPE